MTDELEKELKKAKEAFRSSKFDTAQSHFVKILVLDPQNMDSLLFLSKILKQLDPSSPRILQLLKKANQVDPTDTQPCSNWVVTISSGILLNQQ